MARSVSETLGVRRIRCRLGAWAMLAAIALLAAPAHASLSGVVFEVMAQNANGTGHYQLNAGDLNYNSTTNKWWWSTTSAISIVDDVTSMPIATLSDVSIVYVEDPQVSFGFQVQAGSTNTTFTISSGVLSFATIDPAEAFATAGITLTDNNGNGAILTGMNGGGGAYVSQYNGEVPGGTTFAEFFTSPIVAGINGSNSVNAEFPGGGAFASIGVPVNDISAQFRFTLTAGDSASGTSNFTVIPAPGGLAILGLGLLSRRRRRRNH